MTILVAWTKAVTINVCRPQRNKNEIKLNIFSISGMWKLRIYNFGKRIGKNINISILYLSIYRLISSYLSIHI